MLLRSDDVELFYESSGDGFPVVLVHPFPVHHEFWRPLVPALSARYRLLLPDLRGHGRSGVGTGTATMGKHADDLLRLLEAENVARAAFVLVSIGGYIAFEFWRRYRERVAALVLANTRAEPDTEQGRIQRLQSVAEARQQGPSAFFDRQTQNLLGQTTRRNRPDVVAKARGMMQAMSVEGLAAVQTGMAERPDSVPTLRTISVDTLVIAGEEDTVTPVANARALQQHIPGAKLVVLPRVGHYAALENPTDFGPVLRQFLDGLRF